MNIFYYLYLQRSALTSARASWSQNLDMCLLTTLSARNLWCLSTLEILPHSPQSLIISWTCTVIFIHESADAAKLVAAKHILHSRKYNLSSFWFFFNKKVLFLKKNQTVRFKFSTTRCKSLFKNAQLAWWWVTNQKSEWNFPIIWALATRLAEEKQGRWRETQQFGGNRWPLRTWYMKLITLSQIQLVAGIHYLNFHNCEQADIKWGFSD